jgi:hypothetical protein
MTPQKYKELIKASGGFTKKTKSRTLSGDRPQPLSATDEAALSTSWKWESSRFFSKTENKKDKQKATV